MDTPIRICFVKNISQPIAEVVVESEKVDFFPVLWTVSKNIIGMSYKYEGKLIEKKPDFVTQKIAVSFSILFPNNYTRDKFIEEAKQRRGR